MNKIEFGKNIEMQLKQLMKDYHYIDIIEIENNYYIISDKYSIVFNINYGEVDISYLFMQNDKLMEIPFNNFIASSFTKEDRADFIPQNNIYDNMFEQIKLICRGFKNHWNLILLGENEWRKEYEKSEYNYALRKFNGREEKEIIDIMVK